MKELRELIYNEQFLEWNYEGGCDKANEVLEEIELINKNPMLLNYVLKALILNGIEIKDYFYIVVHTEYRGKVYDTTIRKIFNSVEEAETYARTGDWSDGLLFEKYSIKTIISDPLVTND